MLKKVSSAVLVSQASSTYQKGTPPALASLATLLGKGRVLARLGWVGVIEDIFEHPCDSY